MSAPSDDLELIDLLARLRREHGIVVSYQRLWAAVVNGHVPGYRNGRRWRVRAADAPRVAEFFAACATAA